jgi:hypothetical protein
MRRKIFKRPKALPVGAVVREGEGGDNMARGVRIMEELCGWVRNGTDITLLSPSAAAILTTLSANNLMLLAAEVPIAALGYHFATPMDLVAIDTAKGLLCIIEVKAAAGGYIDEPVERWRSTVKDIMEAHGVPPTAFVRFHVQVSAVGGGGRCWRASHCRASAAPPPRLRRATAAPPPRHHRASAAPPPRLRRATAAPPTEPTPNRCPRRRPRPSTGEAGPTRLSRRWGRRTQRAAPPTTRCVAGGPGRPTSLRRPPRGTQDAAPKARDLPTRVRRAVHVRVGRHEAPREGTYATPPGISPGCYGRITGPNHREAGPAGRGHQGAPAAA